MVNLLKLFSALNGALAVLGYAVNTIFWCIPIFLLSVLKIVPIPSLRRMLSYLLDACATAWISVNNVNQRMFSRTRITTSNLNNLTPNDWYLVLSNHQSWVDILILQRIFNRKIPFLKFFLKHQLIWVPLLGLAWWALDFPFMRRYSKSFLSKHPHLKGRDLETTRIACEKFRYKPVSIMNFVEGTRFSAAKHARQNSSFQQLLKPKAGGIAFVLSAMGNHLQQLLDVTIYYPNGVPSFWDFVCGKVKHVQVQVEVRSIQALFTHEIFSEDYFDNPAAKAKFQQWLNEIWQQKDQKLIEMAARS